MRDRHLGIETDSVQRQLDCYYDIERRLTRILSREPRPSSLMCKYCSTKATKVQLTHARDQISGLKETLVYREEKPMKETIARTWTADEIEEVLRKALGIPSAASIGFKVGHESRGPHDVQVFESFHAEWTTEDEED